MIVTPDGRRYLNMGRGTREPNPYHLRWLLPWMLRDSLLAWAVSAWASIALCAVLVALLARQHGLTDAQALVAAALWLGLPSVRFLARAPVLVDAQGTAAALGCAVLFPDYPAAAVAVALLGATTWEKAPVFAALFAWSPWPLVALVVPAVRYFAYAAPDPTQRDRQMAVLESKIATGLMSRVEVWRSADAMLWPWGACLAALLAPGLWWMAALAVAASQLFVAYDTVRLLQHAAPAVAIAAATVIPTEWALLVLAVHWCNPRMGNGV